MHTVSVYLVGTNLGHGSSREKCQTTGDEQTLILLVMCFTLLYSALSIK